MNNIIINKQFIQMMIEQKYDLAQADDISINFEYNLKPYRTASIIALLSSILF